MQSHAGSDRMLASLSGGYRPSPLMSVVSPRSFLVGDDLKHDGGRETARRRYVRSACGRTTLNGMEIGCREETEWLNRVPSRDGGKEGYITASEHPLFLSVTLYLARTRLAFFPFGSHSRLSCFYFHSPSLKILVVCWLQN